MWQKLERPPLSAQRLRHDLRELAWQIEVLGEVESTQEEAIRRGHDSDHVVIAEYQKAGRGRRERTWVSPPQAGITMSLAFTKISPTPWMGIGVSLAAIEAVNHLSDAQATLKWPNDLLLNEKKFGGVISEVHGDCVVVGIGINVSTTRDELPLESATSLFLEGFPLDREPLVKEVLRRVTREIPSDFLDRYRANLSTLGKEVKVMTPQGEEHGRAMDIDSEGRLVLESGKSFAVGDVIHVR